MISFATRLCLRDVAVDRVHEPKREQQLPLCIERGVVLEDQFDESAAIDQPQVLAPGGSPKGGGRAAAATAIAPYGVGAKVSQDGPIVAIAGATATVQFAMG